MISKPTIIITHPRSGGAFLTRCLSNHPQVGAERGEVLHADRVARYEIPGIIDSVLLRLALERHDYAVGLAKLVYEQVSTDAWQYLVKNDAAVIHLYRENVLRAAVSYYLTQYTEHYHAHSYATARPEREHIAPRKLIELCTSLYEAQLAWIERLSESGLRVLTLTYAEVVGDEDNEALLIPEAIAHSICTFLNIRYHVLWCDLRRTTYAPLAEVVENWGEVEPVVAASDFAYCLADEKGYMRLSQDENNSIDRERR